MSTSSNKQQKKGKDGMGKEGKRKEMVKDWCGVSCVWKGKYEYVVYGQVALYACMIMYVCMYVCMYGRMDIRMDGWMDGWMYGWCQMATDDAGTTVSSAPNMSQCTQKCK